jgi:hypothetical protein
VVGLPEEVDVFGKYFLRLGYLKAVAQGGSEILVY